MRQKQVFCVPTYVVGYPPFDLEAAQRYRRRLPRWIRRPARRYGGHIHGKARGRERAIEEDENVGAPTLADDDFEFHRP